ncbi:MAG: polyphosphate kinase 2 [Caulobacteraceae bacterium]|nr:polyphosphate kinase 2 [Caulobacteraceae bacterium]
MSKVKHYDDRLLALQTALVKAQAWSIEKGLKVVVVFEGRDAAGKDGAIKRLTEYASARKTKVVSLPKPTEREDTEWWFQRYVAQLPCASEWVLFNRSWYNRAGVERVMGFSTPQEQEQFLEDAPGFEAMLINAGIVLIKLWLDISKAEQAERLEARRNDPLKQLKISALDAEAQSRWDAYTAARDEMLLRTSTKTSPWICVATDSKKAARLAILGHVLERLDAPGAARIETPDPDVLFTFEKAALKDGRLHR